jgi:hypothetical protein
MKNAAMKKPPEGGFCFLLTAHPNQTAEDGLPGGVA